MTGFDIVIRGGLVVDGTGRPGNLADVGLADGRIKAVGDLSAAADAKVIDASGQIVAPGFIDIHTHSDMTHLFDGRAESQIRQGVTTEAIGQCGLSLAPCVPEHRDDLFEVIGAPKQGSWHTYAELLEAMDEARIATNVVGMVGHGALRTAVMGPRGDRPADDAEVRQMVGLLRESLDAGAFGFTTGLEYHPGKDAGFDELAALCTATAEVDAIYATHARNRDRRYFAGMGEALDVARVSGVRLQISHINPKYGRPEHAMRNTLQMIEWSREEGIDVAMDMMPTTWNHTDATAMLPSWSKALPTEELLALIRTTEGRRRLRDNPLPMWQLVAEGRWNRVRLLTSSANQGLIGRTIAEITEERDTAGGWDTLFDLLVEEGPRLRSMMLTGNAFDDADNRLVLEHPLCSVESDTMAVANDGILASLVFGLHCYGWVPRFLAGYVRDDGVLTLEEGVRRLTGLPADRLGLDDRGELREGAAADVVVFELDALKDNASFAEPRVYPTGISHVLVNGVEVFGPDGRTGDDAGQVLRRTR